MTISQEEFNRRMDDLDRENPEPRAKLEAVQPHDKAEVLRMAKLIAPLTIPPTSILHRAAAMLRAYASILPNDVAPCNKCDGKGWYMVTDGIRRQESQKCECTTVSTDKTLPVKTAKNSGNGIAEIMENISKDNEIRALRMKITQHHNFLCDLAIMLQEDEIDEVKEKITEMLS